MATDKIDSFNEKAGMLFRPLLEKFGYSLQEQKINELYGKKWSTAHTYVNEASKRKVVIEQAPYYTDYGFSFFIYKLGTDQYNILYNVPHEKQDEDGKFLDKIYDELMSSPELIDLISGKKWISYDI